MRHASCKFFENRAKNSCVVWGRGVGWKRNLTGCTVEETEISLDALEGTKDSAENVKKTASLETLWRELEEERWRHAKYEQAEHIEYERLCLLVDASRRKAHEAVDEKYGGEMKDLTSAHKALVSQNIAHHVARMAQLEWALRSELQRQQDDVLRLQKQWDQALVKLNKTQGVTSVDLNVGGQRFTVATRLLTKYPTSYFGIMFSGRWDVKAGADGAFFVDRNPSVFSYILDWLRDDCLDIELSESKHRALLKDAEFYQFDELSRLLQPHAWLIQATPNGELSDDQLTLRNTGNHIWDCAARGTVGWEDGVHEWTVRLDSGSNDVILGICLESIHTCNASLNADRCFFVNCYTGKAFDMLRHEHVCFHRSNLKAGSLITLVLDMDRREMYFGLDGEKLPLPTFTDIPARKWFPFFGLFDRDACVTVVSN